MAIRDKGEQVVDALRLSDKEHADIVNRMNRCDEFVNNSDKRSESRLPYNPGAVRMKIMSHGGMAKTYLVRPRNISPHGMSVLHGVFVYNGSSCQLQLTTTDGESVFVMGQVVFCQHVEGKVHEVGIRFENPVDISAFVEMGSDSSASSEGDDSYSKLHGTVLYVEDSVIDRELLNFRLKEMGVWMLAAESGQQAMKQVKDNPQLDLILMDVWLPGETGFEILEQVRGLGYTGPVVMVSADATEENRKSAAELGADSFMEKPFKMPELFRTLTKHLSGDDQPHDDTTLHSEFWSDPNMRPLILKFLDQLDAQVKDVVAAVEQSNMAHAQQICQGLKGSAGNYGFVQISDIAGELRAALAVGDTEKSLDDLLDELAQLRDRACKVTQP